jgi:hypothetical protein
MRQPLGGSRSDNAVRLQRAKRESLKGEATLAEPDAVILAKNFSLFVTFFFRLHSLAAKLT